MKSYFSEYENTSKQHLSLNHLIYESLLKLNTIKLGHFSVKDFN